MTYENTCKVCLSGEYCEEHPVPAMTNSRTVPVEFLKELLCSVPTRSAPGSVYQRLAVIIAAAPAGVEGEQAAAGTARTIDIVFDGPPSHESGRFVEVEDATGHSISLGKWIQRPDGYWVLRIPDPRELATARAGERERCARVCDRRFVAVRDNDDEHYVLDEIENCAKAIRALTDEPTNAATDESPPSPRQFYICRTCNGAGKVNPLQHCPDCNGTGKKPTESAAQQNNQAGSSKDELEAPSSGNLPNTSGSAVAAPTVDDLVKRLRARANLWRSNDKHQVFNYTIDLLDYAADFIEQSREVSDQ